MIRDINHLKKWISDLLKISQRQTMQVVEWIFFNYYKGGQDHFYQK